MKKRIIQVHFFTTNKIWMKSPSNQTKHTQNRITNKFSIFSHNKWTSKKINTTQVPQIIPTSSIFKRVCKNNIKIQFFSRKIKKMRMLQNQEREKTKLKETTLLQVSSFVRELCDEFWGNCGLCDDAVGWRSKLGLSFIFSF